MPSNNNDSDPDNDYYISEDDNEDDSDDEEEENDDVEIFKRVDGYNNYSVSTFGNVRNDTTNHKVY